MSTARHQLAGAPGTGTTIDNMASRAKAWVNFDGTLALGTSMAGVKASLNISSMVDNAVGAAQFNQVAAYTSAVAALAGTVNSSQGVKATLIGSQETAGRIGMATTNNAGTYADTTDGGIHACGTLA